MHAYLTGLGTGLSLIVAIGAQNAFVLKQGLMRQHVFAVCLFCALSDAALIALGVGGAGAIAERAPLALQAMRWFGAAFLIWYGLRAFLSAWRGDAALRAQGAGGASLSATLVTIAALTWLNPHVWLDTVVLLGAISASYPALPFAAGAITGSFLFFFALGYGARLLDPVFRRPRAWQVLDVLIGVVMWSIALGLIVSG